MLVCGDARHIPIRSDSVQCVVTSPPYWGLRDYSANGQIGLEKTPEAYVAELMAVFREIWRVLRKNGTIWIVLGDSYAGNGKSGRADADRAIPRGDGSFGEPSGKTTRSDFIRRGEDLKPKDLVGIPWRVAFALQSDGWYLRSDIIWSKPNPMPESVTDRPTKAHEYVFLLTKSERYYYDQEAVMEAGNGWHGSLFEDGKNAIVHPNVGKNRSPHMQERPRNDGERWRIVDGGVAARGFRNMRTVWTIATEPYSGAHFATFPRKLIEPMILAGTRLGDLVLDPFVGSGTTVHVARGLGRRGIGLDLKYFDLSASRIYGPLFASTINA